MAFNRYYQEELEYLRELGAEFASRNASLAPFLSRESFDPDVERLMEGFAFLTGRLRQKLDDELPEFSHSLTQIVWPHLLAPIPAMTVIQFDPIGAAGRARRVVKRGSEVGSRPIRGGRCLFRTCYDVQLTPAQIVDARAEILAQRGRIRLELQLTDEAEFAELKLDALRFYLVSWRNGAHARALYLALRTQCRGVRVEDAFGNGFNLPPDAISPVGFHPDEAVLPYPEKVASGYRLFQEYFLFPDKFMFLDLCSLEQTAGFQGQRLILIFDLEEPLPESASLVADRLRLNATPAVNIFNANADPINIKHQKMEYPLTARDSSGNRHMIHSVRRVTGRVSGGLEAQEPIDYASLETFEVLRKAGNAPAFYSLRRHLNPVTDEVNTAIAFSRPQYVASRISETETISIEVRCTNGTLAADIPTGYIDQMTDGSPNFATFRDIQPMRPEIPPPLDAALMRRLIASMAVNFGSLLNVEALRTVMATCNTRIQVDYQERQRHALMSEGLVEVSVAPLDWIIRGLLVRGADITVTVDESKFEDVGSVYLFSVALSAFMDAMAGINTVHRMTVIARGENRSFRGPVRTGRRPVL